VQSAGGALAPRATPQVAGCRVSPLPLTVSIFGPPRRSRARFLLLGKPVYAIPPRLDDGTTHVTGLSCPDCGGVLKVETEGRDATLVFECRIGHTFDVPELLAGKAERLEEHLWAANTLLEELAELLTDLAQGDGRGEPIAAVRAFRERAGRAKGNAVALRVVIQESRPVDLTPADPGKSLWGAPRAEGVEPGAGPNGP
jgi:hypothetical protein